MKIRGMNVPVALPLLAVLMVGLLWMRPRTLPPTGQSPAEGWRGETMGTTYEVKLAGETLDGPARVALRAKVEAELAAVNAAMSTYLPDSEISRWNRLGAGELLPVSDRFRRVLARSLEIWELSGGAFDPSLSPLIDLWGFGAGAAAPGRPTETQIAAARARMGMDGLALEADGLHKLREGLQINLSAIAKGYGVDQVMALLRAEGFEHIYVEIGGEVACAGLSPARRPWRIGIQLPLPDSGESALRVVELRDTALATSGDYRNFLEEGVERRHHILDPRSGAPADHRLASVSVLHADCMTADALATALYVMGTEEGLRWLEGREGVEALFIDREGDGFRISSTPGFARAIVDLP